METNSILQGLIENRRSTKPAEMNGKIIPNENIQQLIVLANWAPTHGRTEPWRFVVYEQAAKQQFCHDHAELYKNNTDPEKFMQGKYEKLRQQADLLSHIVIVYMKRSIGSNIPALEETAATAAAIQNFLLGAQAMGIAALWSTGGMTHHPAMKNYLNLHEEDIVLGLLFLGYTDEAPKPGKRMIPVEEKVIWRSGR